VGVGVGVGVGLGVGVAEIGCGPPPVEPPPQADTPNASTTAQAVDPKSRFVISSSAQAVENARLPSTTYGLGFLSICLRASIY
jgi:hypothetical protein